MIKGSSIFMTGGAGFIGSALIRRLIENNRVTVYDNLHRDALKHTGLAEHPNLKFVHGDVLDAASVDRSIGDSDIVVHLAAIAGVDTVLSMPVRTMEVALIGSYNMLKACAGRKGIKRFIDFSTSEVYGAVARDVKESDATPVGAVGEARWTYAVSKLAAEHLAFSYYLQQKLPAVSIRPFNIFGPMQVGIGAIHLFVKSALKGETLRLNNGGSQVRSWCYIDDIADAVLLCMEKEAAVGEAFNIGNPRNTLSIKELAGMVVRISGSSSGIVDEKKDAPDVEIRCPDISKAERILGFSPKVGLEEGLKRTIDWYRENLNG
ncbi:MAG: NAD-dependent epimerase/dehydratase family protein [Candidatus Omnitrophota bacterium]